MKPKLDPAWVLMQLAWCRRRERHCRQQAGSGWHFWQGEWWFWRREAAWWHRMSLTWVRLRDEMKAAATRAPQPLAE